MVTMFLCLFFSAAQADCPGYFDPQTEGCRSTVPTGDSCNVGCALGYRNSHQDGFFYNSLCSAGNTQQPQPVMQCGYSDFFVDTFDGPDGTPPSTSWTQTGSINHNGNQMCGQPNSAIKFARLVNTPTKTAVRLHLKTANTRWGIRFYDLDGNESFYLAIDGTGVSLNGAGGVVVSTSFTFDNPTSSIYIFYVSFVTAPGVLTANITVVADQTFESFGQGSISIPFSYNSVNTPYVMELFVQDLAHCWDAMSLDAQSVPIFPWDGANPFNVRVDLLLQNQQVLINQSVGFLRITLNGPRTTLYTTGSSLGKIDLQCVVIPPFSIVKAVDIPLETLNLVVNVPQILNFTFNATGNCYTKFYYYGNENFQPSNAQAGAPVCVKAVSDQTLCNGKCGTVFNGCSNITCACTETCTANFLCVPSCHTQPPSTVGVTSTCNTTKSGARCVRSCGGGYTGSVAFTCNQGTWSSAAGSCAPPKPTVTILSPTTSVYANSVTFTAKVTGYNGGIPAGKVSFLIDGVTPSGGSNKVLSSAGQATYVTQSIPTILDGGRHVITAAYLNTDGKYQNANTGAPNFIHTVNPAAVTVTVSYGLNSTHVGSTYLIKYTLQITGKSIKVQSGSLVLTLNTEPLTTLKVPSTGLVSYTIPASKLRDLGTYVVRARFTPTDSNYQSSSNVVQNFKVVA